MYVFKFYRKDILWFHNYLNKAKNHHSKPKINNYKCIIIYIKEIYSKKKKFELIQVLKKL